MDRQGIEILSWDDVKTIVHEGKLEKLGRSSSQQLIYDNFVDELKKKYNSVVDFILIQKFGMNSHLINNKSSAIRPPGTGIEPLHETRLLPNDFPYNFEEGILHYILWKIKAPILPDDISDAANELMSRIEGSTEFVTYINPPSLKSIPEIDHAHILIFVPQKKIADESDVYP